MARNKHPEQTVQLILETAARLFAQKGYDETSMQDIMDATHLSKGAIYHHFPSKLDILLRIADQILMVNEDMLGEIRDRKGLTGAEKLRELFRTAVLQDYQQQLLGMMPCLLDNPKFLALLIRSVLDDAAPNYVQPILEEGDGGRLHSDGLPPATGPGPAAAHRPVGRSHFTACPAGGGAEPVSLSQSAHPPLRL